MSLITLRSTNNNNGSNVSESAANFSNHFKEGIVISPGDTFELVSMSINKLDKFEIIQGNNDTFIWRIGPGPSSSAAPANFSQHVVVLTAGSYNGADLAKHIEEQVNNSTLLGVYHGGWTCSYTPSTTSAGSTTNAKFTLTYNENTTPTPNGTSLNLAQNYGSGNPYSITNEATPITKKIQMTSNNFFIGNRSVSKNATEPVPPNNIQGYGFSGDRSIFGNGGEYHATFKTCKGLKAIANLDDVRFKNWNNGGSSTDLIDAEWTALSPGDVNLRNGWNYQVDIDTGAAGAIKTFALLGHGGIATVDTFSSGSGYSIGDTGTLEGPQGTSGASYEVSAVNAGAPTAIQIITQGIGFKTDEALILAGAGDAQCTCLTDQINVLDGSNYSLANNVITTPNMSGSGCKVNILATNTGAITNIEIAEEGQGYSVNETLIINGGDNNATFKVESVGPAGEIYYGSFDYAGNLALTQDTDTVSFTNGPSSSWLYHFKMTNGGGGNSTKFQSDPNLTGGSYFIQMERRDGSALDITYYRFFPNASMGVIRDQLYTGFTNNPGNSNAVYTNGKDGMDFQIQCSSQDITNQTGSSPFLFSVYQMKGTAGPVSYPNSGWRTSNDVIIDANPTAWKAGNPQAPTNWASFAEETDQVRFTIKVSGIRNFTFSCSHDTNGDNTFIEEVEFLKTGQASGGDVLIDLNSLTREIFYPLHPVMIISRGLPFEAISAQMGGIFDSKVITQDGKDLRITNSSGSQDPHDYETNIDTAELAAAATPLTLSSMFKFGLLVGNQIFNGNFTSAGPNQITTVDANPNIANLAITLGFENGYSFQNGSATNPVQTADTSAPFTDIITPSLHVELPDFNIKSYSGESSDRGKAICVIPKEQWTTDSKLGTLHYIAPYPLPIKLNVANRQPFYQISARIRQPDGKLADDLINPSQITLKLDRSAEAKQEDALKGALRMFQSVNANNQDSKISNFGSGNPLL